MMLRQAVLVMKVSRLKFIDFLFQYMPLWQCFMKVLCVNFDNILIEYRSSASKNPKLMVSLLKFPMEQI